jgi:K+-transporting ATPase ATPase A chain
MSTADVTQVGLYFVLLLLLARPLGIYMLKVYEGKPCFTGIILGPVENLIYRVCGIDRSEEMEWKGYTKAVLFFNLAGFLFLYALMRLQEVLPWNVRGFGAVSPDLAFNTAVSFVTNTNWQAYGGESTLTNLVQMAGLGVQNFLSAGTGMALLVAMVRGFTRQSAKTIGSFWVDLTRSVLYVLAPLSLVLAIILVSQGVVQTFSEKTEIKLIQPVTTTEGKKIDTQEIALGPVASQIAIKQLGTNGGGFYNVNSAHPFENPTPLSNLLEMIAILLIPAALCYAFGAMVGDIRQGRALIAVMLIILIPMMAGTIWFEHQANPKLTALGVDQTATDLMAGGNMEGKDARFGIIWAAATTAASNGSVNSMHDSFSPLGGLIPMVLMQLGEIIFGGVGSGLYGMLVFAIIGIFLSGLMVGRTPEYLGKKIEAFEIKMASLVILVPIACVLVGTAMAVVLKPGLEGIFNPGPHGFSEALYAFSSASNNNGSAFAGLGANSVFYNVILGLVMLFGRYGVIIPVLAIAGSLASKKTVPAGSGTFPTHTPLFVFLVTGVILIVGALTFMPALALGPIVEHLMLYGQQ